MEMSSPQAACACDDILVSRGRAATVVRVAS